MRAFLVLCLAVLLGGCSLFGGDDLRITYRVEATGARGPVTLTYDGPDGPVRVEDARLPFAEEVRISNARFGQVFLLDAQADYSGPGTLRAEVDAAVGSTPYTAEDERTSPDSDPRTLRVAASITVR